jgi:plasmid stabilization system protein ParE
MSFSVILLSRAKHELTDAWEWYEDKQPGLGDRFIKEVYKTINKIRRNPEHYQLRNSYYR